MEGFTHDGRYAGKKVAITINENKEFSSYYIAEELGQYVPKYLLDTQDLPVIEDAGDTYLNNDFDGVYQCGLKDAWELAKSFIEDFFNPQLEQIEIAKKYNLNPKWGDSLIDLFFKQNPLEAVSTFNLANEDAIFPGDTITLNGKNYVCIESNFDTETFTITKMDEEESGDEL